MFHTVSLISFNWKAFEELFTPPTTRLAEAVVAYLIRTHEEEEFPEIFDQDIDPVLEAEKLFSSKEWRNRIDEYDVFQLDNLISLLFDSYFEREMESQHQSLEVPYEVFAIVDYSFEYLETKQRPSFWSQLKEIMNLIVNVNRPMREIDSLGNRRFRFEISKTQKSPPDEERYSIHTPQQVKRMLAELEPYKTAAETNFKDDDLFQQFLKLVYSPIQSAAQNNLAIYATDNY